MITDISGAGLNRHAVRLGGLDRRQHRLAGRLDTTACSVTVN
jgi:hypothetical protein